jgi:methionine-rich copper-binding protein CopC
MSFALTSVLAALLFASAACRTDTENKHAAAQNDTQTAANETAMPSNFAAGVSDAPPTNAAAPEMAGSILAWSRPAAGSTVSAPVNELQFHFTPPARLGEVTVTGPDGAMPMMVTAIGEVEHYSLPLSGLTAGAFTVDWRASRAGREYRGSFGFSVR